MCFKKEYLNNNSNKDYINKDYININNKYLNINNKDYNNINKDYININNKDYINKDYININNNKDYINKDYININNNKDYININNNKDYINKDYININNSKDYININNSKDYININNNSLFNNNLLKNTIFNKISFIKNIYNKNSINITISSKFNNSTKIFPLLKLDLLKKFADKLNIIKDTNQILINIINIEEFNQSLYILSQNIRFTTKIKINENIINNKLLDIFSECNKESNAHYFLSNSNEIFINGNKNEVVLGRKLLINKIKENYYENIEINDYIEKITKQRMFFFIENTEKDDINSYSISLNIDYYRFINLYFYYNNELEEILINNDSILNIYINKIIIISESIANQRGTLFEILNIYNKITKIEIKADLNIKPSEKTIILKENNKTLIIGQINLIKKIFLNNNLLNLYTEENLPIKVEFIVDNETANFLYGKKYGKTIKISKLTNASIKINTLNNYKEEKIKYLESKNTNFYLNQIKSKIHSKINFSITSTTIKSLIDTIALLNDELPCEITFFINKKYHKKIIGTSGKHIQKIMKKYDVYVKFMNETESFLYNNNNVICKTPCKNKKNLNLIKEEILSLINKVEEKKVEVDIFTYKNVYKIGYEKNIVKEDIESPIDIKESRAVHFTTEKLSTRLPHITSLINLKKNESK